MVAETLNQKLKSNDTSFELNSTALKELESVYPPEGNASRNRGYFFNIYLVALNYYSPIFDSEFAKQTTERQKLFYQSITAVGVGLDTVVAIIHRMDQFKHWRIERTPQINDSDYIAYYRADFHAFHVEIRSLLDSVADLIDKAATKSGQISNVGSFNDLIHWCKKYEKRAHSLLGIHLTELLTSSDWFVPVREMRNSIVHYQRRARIGIIDPPGRIGFYIEYRQGTDSIYNGPPEFIHNGWIYFEPYAGYYLGRLIYLLNNLCELAIDNLDIDKSRMIFAWSMPRFQAAVNCIGLAIEALKAGYPIPEEYRKNPLIESLEESCN